MKVYIYKYNTSPQAEYFMWPNAVYSIWLYAINLEGYQPIFYSDQTLSEYMLYMILSALSRHHVVLCFERDIRYQVNTVGLYAVVFEVCSERVQEIIYTNSS